MRCLTGLLFVALLLMAACKDPYYPNTVAGSKNYLVVEGFINTANNSITRIRLTRSDNVGDTVSVVPELNATITIEQNNTSYPLTATGDSGYYYSHILNLNNSPCKLIITAKNEQYESDIIPVSVTPEIDSIYCKTVADGGQIFISTHDSTNQSKFFRWDYEETWEYHSPQKSILMYDWSKRIVTARPAIEADTLYSCFESDVSNTLELSSTTQLSSSVIKDRPLTLVPNLSRKFSVYYSILVHQYALSEAAYTYLANMKKITEGLGNIFGPLPSGLKSNIHSTSNPGAQVIGYVYACNLTQKRVFFDPSLFFTAENAYHFQEQKYQRGLSLLHMPIDAPLNSMQLYFLENKSPCPASAGDPPPGPCDDLYQACCNRAIPVAPYFQEGVIVCVVDTLCVDCIFWGKGSRKKPAYWPR